MHGSHVRRAKLAARLSLVGATLCLLAGLAGGSAPIAHAAPSGALTMSPGNSSINNGDDISITLDVQGGVNVHRVLLNLTFNPVVVQAVDANSGAGGIQMLPGAFPGTTIVGSVLQNDANNTTGAITYEYTLSAANAQTTGNGTVATVQFHAIAAGNANIQWTSAQLTDNGAVNSAPSSSSNATLMVGQSVPTSTATTTGTSTATPTVTATPTSTDTPVPGATDTPTVTATATPDGSETPTGSATATQTKSPSPIPTPPATSTPTATGTASAATATPRVTVLDNSNKGAPPQSGVDAGGKTPALPSAGNSGPGVQWWRWIFFLAALMLAVAGWFFTFAIHYGDKEPILVDRGDRRRRKRY
jgi:hypothetical protein